jgi:transposase InsO family protein
VIELALKVGVKPACEALNFARAKFYRRRAGPQPKLPRRKPRRALSSAERGQILLTLDSPPYLDQAPAQVYADLLDQGIYLASLRTFYRILAENRQLRERRNQLRHPDYHKPELLATAPNQVWTWDITKLRGPVKGLYFFLYVILDLFSRYAVGWMIAHHESGELAKELFEQTCAKYRIQPGQLISHSDRGAPMKSHSLAQLLDALEIAASFSRPQVSNDNPFSESHFKTLKYRPQFPDRFGSILEARAFCVEFFDWYNNHHYHSGIGWLTPQMVQLGTAQQVIENRKQVLAQAFASHPERFVRNFPLPPKLPDQVWINQPQTPEQSVDLYNKFPTRVSQNA